MKKTQLMALAGVMLAAANNLTATAGGLLTNTNQNVAFLRNPARDAAIGIDGVYTNPAGVAFLNDGLHLSINWQNAHQTRTITTAYANWFANNTSNPAPISSDGYAYREFKGTADAPVLPSVQAAYNKDNWSLQFGFAVAGGGGKCEFDNGLGSFEGIVGQIQQTVSPYGIDGYSFDSYMRGNQYYFGFTLGAAIKLTDNFSVYGGTRMLLGSASYVGYVKNIQLHSVGGQSIPASTFFQQAGQPPMAFMTQDITLDCDQSGLGFSPVIGVDWKLGKLNLAAKYDFKTVMELKNKSTNSANAERLTPLQKFADGGLVREDSPALLTVGAQYEVTDQLRLSAGWHHFFDRDTKQYTKDQLGDTNEYNFGAEYDVNKYLQVSAGVQKTNYDMEESFMNDISFNVSSYTFGLGVGVQVSNAVKLNAAYFQTNYDTMDVTTNQGAVKNSYTRTNRVFGIGCDLTF